MVAPALRSVAGLFFPPVCLLCGKRKEWSRVPVCEECLSRQARMNYVSGVHGTVERLFWKHFPVERATAMYFFHEGRIRQLIHAIKYHQHPEIGLHVAARWAEEMQTTDFFDGVDAIIPLPVHWRHWLKRGYNQTYYIARGISRVTHIPVLRGVVVRRKRGTTQTQARGSEERKKNVQGAFRLKHKERVEGMHVLLVDDVLTTGATLTSCARELAKAAGIRISVFALAYAGTILYPAEDKRPDYVGAEDDDFVFEW